MEQITVSEAQGALHRLVKACQEQPIVITRGHDHKPAVVMLSVQQYARLENVVMRGYEAGKVSEGIASKALGLDRLDFRTRLEGWREQEAEERARLLGEGKDGEG